MTEGKNLTFLHNHFDFPSLPTLQHNYIYNFD